MYFSSRHSLGKTLAARVTELRGQEPIVLCLKENALSAAISLAAEVHGWVYPLLTQPVIIPGDDRIIGVLNQDGELCYNPQLSKYELEDLEMNNHATIEDASRVAFSELNRRVGEYGQLNKTALRGRTVIIIGDIVRDQLEIGAAHELLKTIATGKIVSLVGNITPDGSTALYRESSDSVFLDILPHMFDDDHYFEQPDGYTPEERRQLAMNLSLIHI